MKKIICLVLQFFLFTGLFAQQKPLTTPEARAGKLTDWMKTKLKLLGYQGPPVYEINLRYARKTDELMNSSLGSTERLKIFKENDKARDAALKEVFTTGQYKVYQSKKVQMIRKFKEELKTSRGG